VSQDARECEYEVGASLLQRVGLRYGNACSIAYIVCVAYFSTARVANLRSCGR
jgi:hypothetical protein